MDEYYERQRKSTSCYGGNPNKVENQNTEAVSGAKATAINKNWNIVYAQVINGSAFAENEAEKYAAAANAQKSEDFLSKLKDTLDNSSGNEVEAETDESVAVGLARVRNLNITGTVSVVVI